MKKILLFIGLVFLTYKMDAQNSILKLSDSLMQVGNYQAALQKLEKINNSSADIFEKIAGIYQKVGDNSKAIENYMKAYQLNPSDKIKEKLGKSYQFRGNSDKAIRLYNEVLSANPDNLLLKYNLAKLYMAERKTSFAVKLLKELIQKDSLNPNYYYQLGEVYEKLNKDPSKVYLKAYALDSLHLKSIYNLAKFYKSIKVKDSTGLFIDIGLKISPDNLNFIQLKAQNEFLKKEYDTTLVYLKELEKQNFETMFVYKLFGLSYYNLKEYENALIYFRKASQKDFKDTTISYNLGLVYKALKDYKKAEMSFLMSIMFQKPQVDKNYYQLGLVQLEQGNQKKAIESFEEAFKNNPGNHIVLLRLAIISDDYYKDQKIAIKHFEKYIDKFSKKDEESTLYVKGRIKEIKKELFIKGEKID